MLAVKADHLCNLAHRDGGGGETAISTTCATVNGPAPEGKPRPIAMEHFSQIISVNPHDVISYDVVDPSSEARSLLKLRNLTEHGVLYKVKMTNPFLLRAQPACGILFPSETVEVTTILTTGMNASSEMFLVQAVLLSDDELEARSPSDLWRAVVKSRRRAGVLGHRLAVRVTGQCITTAKDSRVQTTAPETKRVAEALPSGDKAKLLVASASTSPPVGYEMDLMIAFASAVEALCGVGWRVNTNEIRLGGLAAPLAAASAHCEAASRQLQSLRDGVQQFAASLASCGLGADVRILRCEYEEHRLHCEAATHGLHVQCLTLSAEFRAASWRLGAIKRDWTTRRRDPTGLQSVTVSCNVNGNAHVKKDRIARLEGRQTQLWRKTHAAVAEAKKLSAKTEAMAALVTKVYSGLRRQRQQLVSTRQWTLNLATTNAPPVDISKGEVLHRERQAMQVATLDPRLASASVGCEKTLDGMRREQKAILRVTERTSADCKMAKQYLSGLSSGVYDEHVHIYRDSFYLRRHLVSHDGSQIGLNDFLIQTHKELMSAFARSRRLVRLTRKAIADVIGYQAEVAEDLARLHQEAKAHRRQEKSQHEEGFAEIQQGVADVVGDVRHASQGLRLVKDRMSELSEDLGQLIDQTEREIRSLDAGLQSASKNYKKEVLRCNGLLKAKMTELAQGASLIEDYLKSADTDADRLHRDFQQNKEMFSGLLNKVKGDILGQPLRELRNAENSFADLRANVVDAIHKLVAMTDAVPEMTAGEERARDKFGSDAKRLAQGIRELEAKHATCAALQNDEEAIIHDEIAQKTRDQSKQLKALANTVKSLGRQCSTVDSKAREEIEKCRNEMEVTGIRQFNQSNNAREKISEMLRKSRSNDHRAIFEERKRAMKAVKDDVEARTKEDVDAIHASLRDLSYKMDSVKKRAAAAEKASEWIFYFEVALTVATCIFLYFVCSKPAAAQSESEATELTWFDLLLAVIYS